MAKHNFEDSTAELAHDIVENAQELVRLEIALAKQEVKELAITNAVAAVLALIGRSRLRIEVPQRTLSSLRETKSWALRQLSTSSR